MSKKTYKYDGKRITVSNLEKIFYPDKGYTKKDIIGYYIKIAQVILPHLRNRPLNMHRAPDGLKGENFYQQDISDYFPQWIDRISIRKKEGGTITHVLCNKKETLLYLAGQAVITMHVWLSTTAYLNKPDKLLFDLDPPQDSGFESVKRGALKLKEYFDSFSVKSFVMTTGSKGLHVAVPLVPEYEFDEVRLAAKKIAASLTRNFPECFTTEQPKAKREGRLFLDYLRNSYGQTSVCPYSLRILPRAPAATPLDWEELKKPGLNARTYHLGNIPKRLGQKKDPWKDFNEHRLSLKKISR
ncbi:MAG: non-homologous end-joining DNA ligase [Actinomycetota bacterium]